MLEKIPDPSIDSNSIFFSQNHKALINDVLGDEEDEVSIIYSQNKKSFENDSLHSLANNIKRGNNSVDRQNIMISNDLFIPSYI
mgnify:CR=1 FL=1